MQQWEDFAFMAMEEVLVRLLVPVGAIIFHAILFRIAFNLTVAKHGQSGQCGHNGADAEVFIALAKLLHSRFFIGIVHEIYITLQNLRVVNQCVFNQLAVFFVFLIAQHVHEGAVIHAVHSQRPYKITFHQPECFSQQECIWHLAGDPLYHFTPKLFGHGPVEFFA